MVNSVHLSSVSGSFDALKGDFLFTNIFIWAVNIKVINIACPKMLGILVLFSF